MVKGEPYFVKIRKPDNLKIKMIICNSFQSKEFYATLVSEDNRIYLLRESDYNLMKLPIDDYNPDTQSLQITGNLFYKTVELAAEGFVKVYAIDRAYNKVDEYYQSWPVKSDMPVGKMSSYLFPFSIEMEPSNSQFIQFRFNGNSSYKWICLNLLLLVCSLVIIKKQGRKFSRNILDLIVVAATGIFGFVAVNIFSNREY
jgi:hypothetical protein